MNKRLAELIGFVIVFLVLAFALYEWHREVVGRAELRVQLAAENQKQATADKALEALTNSMNDWQSAQERRLAMVDEKFKNVTTPSQVASLATQLMGLKQPIIITTPAATVENPHPAPVATIATEDTPQVKAYLKNCEDCKVNLETAMKSLTYANQQDDLVKEKLASMTVERDAALRAVKGGSLIQRVWHDSKIVAVGGAIGVAVVCLTGHCK